jgi:pimeloyl-ACP methyl ester carboxylesterase
VWFPALGTLYAANLASFRSTMLAEVRRRWFRGLDAPTAEALCPSDVLECWWQETVSADPVGAAQSPPRLYAPNGVVADLVQYWAAGVPTYDPGGITSPVLLILGEWDVDTPPDMAQGLFNRLTAAPYKRLEILGRGTHSMSLELNRFDLYRRVGSFLGSHFLLSD